MSITGISGSSFFSGLGSANLHSKFLQMQQEFQQVGRDLQSGNLKQAQSDFATLQQEIQQQQGTGQAPRHHHHHRVENSQDYDSSQQNTITSLFSQLGQELQSGNVTQAQQTYSTLQQDFQQFAASTGFGSTASNRSSGGGLNLTA